jgi:hypothetical protein
VSRVPYTKFFVRVPADLTFVAASLAAIVADRVGCEKGRWGRRARAADGRSRLELQLSRWLLAAQLLGEDVGTPSRYGSSCDGRAWQEHGLMHGQLQHSYVLRAARVSF